MKRTVSGERIYKAATRSISRPANRIRHLLGSVASNKQENSHSVAKDLRLRIFESMLDRGCERRMKPNENSNKAFESSEVSSSHNVSETFLPIIRNIR